MLIVEATPPPLHGEQQHIHLTAKKVESQQFLSESADRTDRVNEISGRETKAVYPAQHWGCEHCNADLICAAQVAFHKQLNMFLQYTLE